MRQDEGWCVARLRDERFGAGQGDDERECEALAQHWCQGDYQRFARNLARLERKAEHEPSGTRELVASNGWLRPGDQVFDLLGGS